LVFEKNIRSPLAMAKKPELTVVNPDSCVVQPPRRLGKYGASLWTRVQSEYGITDVGGVEIWAQACAATDRVEAIAAAISSDGEVIKTRTGLRTHPAIREETALRALIIRTLQKLGVTQELVKPPGRPGGLGPQF
jgi:hypothetical protein